MHCSRLTSRGKGSKTVVHLVPRGPGWSGAGLLGRPTGFRTGKREGGAGMLPTPGNPADNALLVCVITHHLVGFLNIPGFLVKSHQQVFVFLCPNHVPTGQWAHRIT